MLAKQTEEWALEAKKAACAKDPSWERAQLILENDWEDPRVAGHPEPRDKSQKMWENRQGDQRLLMLSLVDYTLLRIWS